MANHSSTLTSTLLTAGTHSHDATQSPGSSVFDLPTQSQPQRDLRTSTLPHILDANWAHSTSSIVISGGTGGNAICAAFEDACSYVLPVSDDGGSSSEIIRVLGGPSIGDIRSRLIRLIPAAPPSSPLSAIRNLLSYRLPSDKDTARNEWRAIVEGRSRHWQGIPNDRKETIRGFLVYFESELLKRAHKGFSFVNGSVGNYFLAATQRFFRSLPSAIFLFASITNSQANIVPVIVTNHIVTIAVELENGEKIVGQCEISHPMPPSLSDIHIHVEEADQFAPVDGMGEVFAPRPENVLFNASGKARYEAMNSRISRLYYINAYGHEIHPAPNPDYITNLAEKEVLVYSVGSLWTSIIPTLALRGVASAIARSRSLRAKILLLNSKNDRETDGYTGVDYIQAIAQTLNARYQVEPYGLARGNANTTYPVSAFVTDLVYLRGTGVVVDVAAITALGVRCTEVDGDMSGDSATPHFNADIVRSAVDDIMASSR